MARLTYERGPASGMCDQQSVVFPLPSSGGAFDGCPFPHLPRTATRWSLRAALPPTLYEDHLWPSLAGTVSMTVEHDAQGDAIAVEILIWNLTDRPVADPLQ